MTVDQALSPRIASLEALLVQGYSGLDEWLERILHGPRWKPAALLLVLALSLFRAFPSYDALRTPFVVATWQHAQVKIDRPSVDLSRLFPPESHESKLTFRVAVPLLAHALHLRQAGVIAISMLAGVLLFHSVLGIAFQLAFTCCAISFVVPTYYVEGSAGFWWLYPLPVQAFRWMLSLA